MPDLVESHEQTPAWSFWAILLVALSLSIGWGIRGNWGHEYGAMIPGALAAIAATLVAGRKDWRRRVVYFAFFGALGWSFGGSISYMQVIGYTHSGHWPSVLYGFASLFVIGFLWGAPGGAGTALPAFADRERLTEFFVPLVCVFVAWLGEDIFFALVELDAETRQRWVGATIDGWFAGVTEERLNWHDTDWIAVLLAFAAVGLLAIVRRRVCRASALVFYMTIGWWLGFTLLVLALGLRMTPPRGDSWAGMLGLTIGMFVYLWRQRLFAVAWGGVMAGLFSGLGFSGATLIKLVGMTSQWPTNWHSVLEQSYGFISGIGIAVTMAYLSTRAPRLSDDPPLRRWTEPFSLGFVMLLITYVNIRKNIAYAWQPAGLVPAEMYGLSTEAWFAIGYLIATAVFVTLVVARRRGQRLPLVPTDWLGKGQLFYLAFLWWIVLANLGRTLPFHAERLITEGVIHVNACLCTLLVLLVPREEQLLPVRPVPYYKRLLTATALAGMLGALAVVAFEGAVVRSIYGDRYTGDYYADRGLPGRGYASKHIRFGPDATITRPDK